MRFRSRMRLLVAAASVALAAVAFVQGPSASAADGGGAVYVLTNQSAGNAVQVYERAPDGSLAFSGAFPTTGTGTGAGLGSQGALVLKGTRLFAVDAGSNQISDLSVGGGGLTLSHLDTVGSGGVTPISVTVKGTLLYVLNAGDGSNAGNITGFRIRDDGRLHAIPGSTRPLSADSAGPAQVQFSPNGGLLIVTEKATNLIDTYTVSASGLASGPTTHPSAGQTPFGFDVRGKRLFVSEAFGGAQDASAMSSYHIGDGGALHVISASVPTTETAACWVVVTTNGRYAYATNTGSASVSGYRVRPNGAVRLLDADGTTGNTGGAPIDAAVSAGSEFLYTNDSAGHDISAFRIHRDGSLTPVAGASGLPAGAVGLAAR
ncbi:MAG TPA: beta-propeller fold lactonase family protein [Actinomycetota bacterium]